MSNWHSDKFLDTECKFRSLLNSNSQIWTSSFFISNEQLSFWQFFWTQNASSENLKTAFRDKWICNRETPQYGGCHVLETELVYRARSTGKRTRLREWEWGHEQADVPKVELGKQKVEWCTCPFMLPYALLKSDVTHRDHVSVVMDAGSRIVNFIVNFIRDGTVFA